VQNFLTVTGLTFSILVGQTYYFMYQQQESVFNSLSVRLPRPRVWWSRWPWFVRGEGICTVCAWEL
jgi:hypothetical protein